MKTPQLMITLLLALFVFSSANAQNNTVQNQPQPPANAHQQPQMQAPVPGGVPGAPQQNMHLPPVHPSPFANSNLTYKIMELPDHTFGFQLFADGKMMWQQNNLNQRSPVAGPSAQGSQQQHQPQPPSPMKGPGGAFHSRQEAERAAQLSMDKMKRGEMPPMVTMDDMMHPAVKQ